MGIFDAIHFWRNYEKDKKRVGQRGHNKVFRFDNNVIKV